MTKKVETKQLWQRFQRDDQGNIAVIFAGALMTLLAGLGAMMDYGRAYTVRTELAAKLDAALLAAAMGANQQQQANSINAADGNGQIKQRVQQELSLIWSQSHGSSGATVITAKMKDGEVTATARATVPTTLLAALGEETIPVEVGSKIMVGAGEIEMVLVLDETDSMTGSRMDTLKTASADLIEKVFDGATEPDQVKIGVVPFSQHVNVGLGQRGASWLDLEPEYSNSSEQCTMVYPSINCRTETVTYMSDGVERTNEQTRCDRDLSAEPTEQCNTVIDKSEWYGCVGSRNYPLNTQDTGSNIPGLNNYTCASELLALSTDQAVVEAKIDNLNPWGNTYIPSGLMWGWRVLSSGAPFTEAAPYSEMDGGSPLRKVMVIMTDGENTKSPDYPTHNGDDSGLADTLTAEICSNIKASGIEIYAVTFDVTDSATKTLMENCATGKPYYFDAAGSAALMGAFEAIGDSLIQLRIAG